MNHFFECPRCGTKTLERLTTYSHCIECLYFEDHYYDLELAYLDAWEAETHLAKHDFTTTTNDKVDPEDENKSWEPELYESNQNLKES